MKLVRTYSKLITLPTFEERFEYLKLNGVVADETFGSNRWINQAFYRSREWRDFRDRIIIRDNGCDLGVAGYEIHGPILIHHINPITYDDLINRSQCLLDPENVICTNMYTTHNAIHYGDASILITGPIERRPNDTIPWRR